MGFLWAFSSAQRPHFAYKFIWLAVLGNLVVLRDLELPPTFAATHNAGYPCRIGGEYGPGAKGPDEYFDHSPAGPYPEGR